MACVLIAEDDVLAALTLLRVRRPSAASIGAGRWSGRGIGSLALDPAAYALRDGFVTPLATALEQLEVPYALVSGYRGEERETSAEAGTPANQAL
jgi:hypothetical protein